jgi:hypothetical protein
VTPPTQIGVLGRFDEEEEEAEEEEEEKEVVMAAWPVCRQWTHNVYSKLLAAGDGVRLWTESL